jgi:hypothetical protein
MRPLSSVGAADVMPAFLAWIHDDRWIHA